MDEEIARVIPVVEGIVAASDVVVSVDTYRPPSRRPRSRRARASSTTPAGSWDAEMAPVLAGSNATLVLTHSVGPPRAEKPAAHYRRRGGRGRASCTIVWRGPRLRESPHDRLIVDPGHDLDKNTLHSLELTRRFDEIAAIGLPALAAVSNKDFVGESIDRPQGERLEGSLAAMVVCIMKGARIVRMHDVPQTVAAVRMTEAILGMREPARLEHNTHPTDNV